MKKSQVTGEGQGGETPKFNLRLPKEVRERIDEARKRSGRSLNGELVARIQASLDTELPELIHAIQQLGSVVEQLQTSVDEIRKRLDRE